MNIEELLEASNSRAEKADTGHKKLDTSSMEKLINVLKGEDQFEGAIDTPEKMQKILDSIKKFKEEKKTDEDPGAANLKKRLASFYSRVNAIQAIINKLKNDASISRKEEDLYDDFADEVEDVLFYETQYKSAVASETGSSGGKRNKVVFYSAFPIKYTSPEGREYYGLVRPPSGIITWQSDEVRSIVASDSEIKIPKKVPVSISGGIWGLLKSKATEEMFDSKRIEVKNDKPTKVKVRECMEKQGASINDRGDINGMQKALNSVEFWKSIKEIF